MAPPVFIGEHAMFHAGCAGMLVWTVFVVVAARVLLGGC